MTQALSNDVTTADSRTSAKQALQQLQAFGATAPAFPFEALSVLERVLEAAPKPEPVDQFALFNDWLANDGEVPANYNEAHFTVWQAALRAQPSIPSTSAEEQRRLYEQWVTAYTELRASQLDDFFAAWMAALASHPS